MNQRTNVNTEPLDSQANRATLPLLQVKGIIQHATDIAAQAHDAQILLDQIFQQLDEMLDLHPAAAKAVLVIDCFTKCALRNVALIAEANVAILELTGGAA